MDPEFWTRINSELTVVVNALDLLLRDCAEDGGFLTRSQAEELLGDVRRAVQQIVAEIVSLPRT